MVASENRGTWGLNQLFGKHGRRGEGVQLAEYAARGRVCHPAVLLEEKSICTGKLGSDQGKSGEAGSRARGPP